MRAEVLKTWSCFLLEVSGTRSMLAGSAKEEVVFQWLVASSVYHPRATRVERAAKSSEILSKTEQSDLGHSGRFTPLAAQPSPIMPPSVKR